MRNLRLIRLDTGIIQIKNCDTQKYIFSKVDVAVELLNIVSIPITVSMERIFGVMGNNFLINFQNSNANVTLNLV